MATSFFRDVIKGLIATDVSLPAGTLKATEITYQDYRKSYLFM
jgi:hypothetical protein